MNLPVVDTTLECDKNQNIVGVLLAAGTSSRFGDENKLLENVPPGKNELNKRSVEIKDSSSGKPMVRQSALTLLNAGLNDVYVVVGFESENVKNTLDGLDVEFVENPKFELGISSSVKYSIRKILNNEENVDAAVFALGDMPFISPESVCALVAAYEKEERSALAASYKGKRGNPVLFDKVHFPSLRDIEGDTGGKEVLLSANDGALVETGDPGVLKDINDPEHILDFHQ